MNLPDNQPPASNQTATLYQNFWKWFQANEKRFFKVVKEEGNVEQDFFQELSLKLEEIKDGIFYLTGLYDDNTVELVLTPDGAIKNIAVVEELVAAAPELPGWKFTALKPALEANAFSIKMAGFEFSSENLGFYSNDYPEYPDEIDITIVHPDFNEEDKAEITNGVYIFLDNYLGELTSITAIDSLTVTGKDEAQKELIPIEKLKGYLTWREKEFIEKYDGLRHNTDEDSYSMLEAELPNGNALIAVINTDLLEWEGKASHPWILTVEIKYDGKSNKGMPDDVTYQLLDAIESKITAELKDFDGYLNIGRQTADNAREIYFACKDFRKPTKILPPIQESYAGSLAIDFEIYKDKYWQSFNRFKVN